MIQTSAPARPAPLDIILAGSFLFLFWGVLGALIREWWSNNFYSFGFLVPLISLYLLWCRKSELGSAPAKPSPAAGLVVTGFGVLVLVGGHAGHLLILQEAAIPVVMMGSVLLVWGSRVLGVVWFPIAYLFMGIPFWEYLTDGLHMPFQLFSARLGTLLMQTAGIPVFMDGIYLVLPNITLKVGRLCSGVNFLIAVIALGIPLSNLYLRDVWKRVALILFATGVAVLSNSLRVALIGFLAHHRLSDATHGPFHLLQGLFVSAIGFAAVILGLWFFRNKAEPVLDLHHLFTEGTERR